jgi:hypothetical protein
MKTSKGGDLKLRQTVLTGILCVLLAFLAWSPVVVADDPPLAPTAAEMAADPVVSAAIEQAWIDSQTGDEDNRHEEGGWIVQNTETGELSVVRWPAGTRDEITPSPLPQIPCHRVVGEFHTHPNPPVDEEGTEWEQGPSESDIRAAADQGLPAIVRNGAGTVTYGAHRADPVENPHTPLPVEENSSVIPDVPDTNQPPTEDLATTDPSNFCAPMAMVNILYYWDEVMGHPSATGVMAGLPPETVAEYLGYFMNTNDTGSPDRIKFPHSGTYNMDMEPGALEYVRWDMANPFPMMPDPTAPVLPPGKTGYTWTVFTHYAEALGELGFNMLRDQIDEGRPHVVSFMYWNPEDTGLRFTDADTGQKITVFAWGEPTTGSEDPEEEWNWQEGYEGIGHAVTVVGYVPDWDPGESGTPMHYVIVHDNWASTPSYMAIPWLHWKSLTVVSPVLIP